MEEIKNKYTQEGVVSKTTDEYKKAHYNVSVARKAVRKLLDYKGDRKSIEYKENLRKANKVLKANIQTMRKTGSKEKVLSRVYYVRYADD